MGLAFEERLTWQLDSGGVLMDCTTECRAQVGGTIVQRGDGSLFDDHGSDIVRLFPSICHCRGLREGEVGGEKIDGKGKRSEKNMILDEEGEYDNRRR
jgi:hypothetical protein